MTQTTLIKEDLPTSFGAFKPVGHLMVGLPKDVNSEDVAAALRAEGFGDDEVAPFNPQESVAELQGLISNASGLAGFGYEITLMRRYLSLAREGAHWLLVHAEDSETAERAAAVAKRHGALLAVHYRNLTIDELI